MRGSSCTKWIMLLMAALLAASLLSACRGKDKDAAADQPAATEAAAEAAPTAEPADATEEQPAADQPAAEQPAADQAAEQPAADAPDAPASVSGSVMHGVCNHPYYPIRDGAVYRYRITSSDAEPAEMTTQYNVTGPDSFITIQSYGDIATEMAWRCTDEGLLSTDFGMRNMEVPGVEFSLDTVSGVTYPLPDRMQAGNTWQSVFTLSGGMNMEGVTMTMNMEATTDSTMLGFEQVTTPAGTFDAAKIDSTTTVDLKMDMGDLGAMPAPQMPGDGMGSTVWLAEGVGMVRSESGDPAGGQSVTELIAIE